MSTSTYETINAKDKPIAEDFVYVYSEIEDGGFRKVSKAMLKVLLGVATKLSELENDKAFITKTVFDLENYYLKSDTYSKDEIDNRISLIPRFDVQVVSSLPTTNISETTVYLVSSGDDSDNLYTEYINVNGLWEILGTQKIASVENAVLYTAQSLTEEQKTQARTNISAASSEEVRQLEEEKADQTAIPTKTSQLTNDSGFLTEKPTYTASEVGADVSGTAETKVSEHNVSEESHSDIRLLISNLTTLLNTIANSEDVDLDQLSELVAYIKANRTLIESVTTNKVSVADIIDNLTTSASNKPLSAKQGVALKALIDGLSEEIDGIKALLVDGNEVEY